MPATEVADRGEVLVDGLDRGIRVLRRTARSPGARKRVCQKAA